MAMQVSISHFAKNINLQICKYLDQTANDPTNKQKAPISFLSGDPTVYGLKELRMPERGYQILRESILNQSHHGYQNSSGILQLKKAVANLYKPKHPLLPQNVSICHGVNMGLLQVIMAFTNEGDHILVPEVGYPFYNELCPAMKRKAVSYRLMKDKGYEIDLEHVKTLLNDKTTFIYIVNPSNPMGSVFSRHHMLQILQFADEHQLPIVADEVYWKQTFPGVQALSFGQLTDNAPVIVLSGVQKNLSVPGWVQGWIAIFDKHNYIGQVKKNLQVTSTIFLHTNIFTQFALPAIFQEVGLFMSQQMGLIHSAFQKIFNQLATYKGLKPIKAQGTFYIAVEIDFQQFPDIGSDKEFMRLLKLEQNVNLMPLSVFGNLKGFRILSCAQDQYYNVFFARLKQFIEKHIK